MSIIARVSYAKCCALVSALLVMGFLLYFVPSPKDGVMYAWLDRPQWAWLKVAFVLIFIFAAVWNFRLVILAGMKDGIYAYAENGKIFSIGGFKYRSLDVSSGRVSIEKRADIVKIKVENVGDILINTGIVREDRAEVVRNIQNIVASH